MAVVVFTGDDSFRLRRKVRELLREKNADSGAAVQSFDEENEESLSDALARFFDARTLWNKRNIAVAKAASWKGALPSVAEPDLLILILKKAPAASLKKAAVQSFPLLKGAKLATWIRESARELGNTVEHDLVDALILLHGADTEAIWNELMILSTAKPGEKLSADDLKTFRAWIPRVKDFAFIEAVLAKGRKRALALLLQSLADGVSPLLISGNLTAHFRAMLAAKGNEKSAGRYFAGRHPFWVSKIFQHAERFTPEELCGALRRLGRLDYTIKTGKHAPGIALEEFVIGV